MMLPLTLLFLWSALPLQIMASEKEKIEHLIFSIETLASASFQRNGKYYTSKAAADHLRMKWKNAGSRIRTARDFIEKVASASGVTGRPYTIRWPDGKETRASEYLTEQLEKLSAN
jgi:hypothetical protein